MPSLDFPDGTFHLGDCLDVMATLPDASVDMVLCDLPYGTTQNKWDSVIPLAPLWEQYWRVCKPNVAVVLTAAQPFTSVLGASQIKRLKYAWVWQKEPSGNLNAKKMPMPEHEDVMVFGAGKVHYNPQGLQPTLRKRPASDNSRTTNYGIQKAQAYEQTVTNYPRSILPFTKLEGGVGWHPTQKPVALFEYLIRTYTNPGAMVLDNCAGSGTTAIAARQSGRRWVCIERDRTYFGKAITRVHENAL